MDVLEEILKLRKQIETLSQMLDDTQALDYIDIFPRWLVGTEYKAGDRVRYQDLVYKCIQGHTSQSDWTPDIVPALYVKISMEEYPIWVQPQGSHDAYKAGDKVAHLDRHWVSIMDANVFEPSVYGWVEEK